MFKRITILINLCTLCAFLYGQDPHYTQFYSAPLTVNPAYTGVFNGSIRFMSNYRQQWGNLNDPYTTSTAALDFKVGQSDKTDRNPINFGIQFMNDRSMLGAFRSNYLTGLASYHVNLDESHFKTLGGGLSFSYGDRKIDFSSISFDNQFTSGGFNLSLPSGEAAFQNMKPFVTVGAGLLFIYNNPDEGNFFELGISGYHFNKPKQTVLQDKNEYLPVRYSAQISYQRYMNDKTLINLRGLYQSQASVEYFLGGLSVSKLFGDNNQNQIGIGAWYRTGDAISPYVTLEYKKVQIGLSYDITTSNLKDGPSPARSFELSIGLIIENNNNNQKRQNYFKQ